MFAHILYTESEPLLFNRPSRYRKCVNTCEVAFAYLLWPLLFFAAFKILEQIDPLLLKLWGARSGVFLEEYRSISALTWRTAHRLMQGDLWIVYLLMAYVPILLGAQLFQHKLRYYKIINIAFLGIMVFCVCCFFTLLMLPIGRM